MTNNPNQESPVQATKSPKHRTASIPGTDLSLKDLSLTIAASWKMNPQIILIWTGPEAFEATTDLYASSLNQRLITGGNRGEVTNELKVLDEKVDEHVGYVKDYLKEKYSKENYYAWLPQFGISKQDDSYTFPVDRIKRSQALKLTVGALQANGLQDKTYGKAFWQDISQRYDAALKATINNDGSVSGLVNTKNGHKKQIRKTLNALIHIIRGNYPETYASVLREWGFQKEKY